MDDKKARYNGHVSSCMRNGKGTFDYPGASYKYDGDWSNGVKNSKLGKFSLAGCFDYVGEFVNGEMTGKGTKKWADGREYSGEWLCGEMHGFGRWSNANRSITYEGYMDNNKRVGDGTLTIRGDVYRGKFDKNIYNGHGVFLRENKYILDINFVNGIGQSFGSIKWHKIGQLEGNWKNGIPCDHVYFSLDNQSYQYSGSITCGCPDIVSHSILLDMDPYKTKKKTVAAGATGKKGKVEDHLVSFHPGECLGEMFVYTEGLTNEGEASIDISDPQVITLPMPSEIRRKLTLSLCPVLHEEAGAPASGNPGPVALGNPVPLFRKKDTLNSVSKAWARFPSSVNRVLEGSNVLSLGNQIQIEHVSSNPEPPNESMYSTMEDAMGVCCNYLSEDNGSICGVKYTTEPSSMLLDGSCGAEMSLLSDFRLDLWWLLKKFDIPRKHRSVAEITSLMAASNEPVRDDVSVGSSKTRTPRTPRRVSTTPLRSHRSTRTASRSSMLQENGIGPDGDSMEPISKQQSEESARACPADIEITLFSMNRTTRTEHDSISEPGDETVESAGVEKLVLVLIISGKDENIKKLIAKVHEITEYKENVEYSKIKAIHEAVNDAKEKQLQELRHAAELVVEEHQEAPALSKGGSKSGKSIAKLNVTEEPAKPDPIVIDKAEALAKGEAAIAPLDMVDILSFNTTVTWELRSVCESKPEVVEADVDEMGLQENEKNHVVLNRWCDGNFNIITWHSFAVTLRNCKPPNVSTDDDVNAVISSELFVDGHAKQSIFQQHQSGGEAVAVSDADLCISSFMNSFVASGEKLICVVGEENFSGYVKTFALFNKWNRCSSAEVTSCFDQYHLEHNTTTVVMSTPAAVEYPMESLVGEHEETEKAVDDVIVAASVDGLEAVNDVCTNNVKSPELPQPLPDCNLYYKKVLMSNPEDKAVMEAIQKQYMPELHDPVKKEVEVVPEVKAEKGAKTGSLSKQSSVKTGAVPVATPPDCAVNTNSEVDCVKMDSINIYCCGGRGVLDEVIIPKDTKPGHYVLLIRDGVDENAYKISPANLPTESENGSGDPDASPPAEEVITALPTQLVPGSAYLSTSLSVEYSSTCNVGLLAPPTSLEQMYKVVSKLSDNSSNGILIIADESSI